MCDGCSVDFVEIGNADILTSFADDLFDVISSKLLSIIHPCIIFVTKQLLIFPPY